MAVQAATQVLWNIAATGVVLMRHWANRCGTDRWPNHDRLWLNVNWRAWLVNVSRGKWIRVVSHATLLLCGFLLAAQFVDLRLELGILRFHFLGLASGFDGW